MKILFIPIGVHNNDEIRYKFEKDKITALFNGVEDTFDFTSMPDGELQIRDVHEKELIETTLGINPVNSAKRENGELYVELVNFIKLDAPEEQRFPQWIDANDYKEGESNG